MWPRSVEVCGRAGVCRSDADAGSSQGVNAALRLLLLSAVLVDTANLDASVGRATPRDAAAAEALAAGSDGEGFRAELFAALTEAKYDQSALGVKELLVKVWCVFGERSPSEHDIRGLCVIALTCGADTLRCRAGLQAVADGDGRDGGHRGLRRAAGRGGGEGGWG